MTDKIHKTRTEYLKRTLRKEVRTLGNSLKKSDRNILVVS